MDRKKFLKTVGLVTGTTLLSGAVAASAAEKTDKMKIVVLTGSPRRNGNSNHLARQFIKGAEEAGHEVYRFDCAQRKVSGGIACNSCVMDGPCVLKDDFDELRPYLVAADMVAFATPMYYFGFSLQLKRVIDRFYALNGKIKDVRKKAVLMMSFANTSEKEAQPMLLHYKMLLEYLGWEDSGTVVAPGVWTAGSVKDTGYGERAYRLGRNL